MSRMVFDLKEYDLIAIGTGSVMAIVYAMMQDNPNLKVAVIDKDEPGGICLTRRAYSFKNPAVSCRVGEDDREGGDVWDSCGY